jgi:hypothetical protein
MVHRLSRFVLPFSCACALAGAALPSTAAAKVAVGISDNGPAMFSQHNFLRLNLTVARDMVPWNAAITRDKTTLRAAQAWVKAAQNAGAQPMISFTAPGGSAGNYVPSTAVYTAAIKAFLHSVPSVKTYAPWNEPDWTFRPKLAGNPRLAASYFNALARWCKKCTVVAGDVYLPAPQLGSWIKTYKTGLAVKPKAWALHNYYDVRTHSSAQLRTMEALTSGQIWLTEISGVIRRGHWGYPNQSTAAAGRDEGYLFSMPKKFPRIARIYHYQWQGTVDTANTGWDSGLIGPGGVPRPAYWAVAKATGLRHTTRH